jgi:hypothetical protein
MYRRLVIIVAATLCTGTLVSQALAYGTGSAGPCGSGNIARTSSYILALSIGHSEEMYLPSEVKARHIKTGEIMLGGEMVMIDHPPAGTKIYHLEVHICTKSGAVVTKLKPDIAVVDPRLRAVNTHLPVAIMVGVGAGLSDYHYGNDVALRPGSRITVTVTVKGQRAVFHATVPRLG